MIQSKRDEYVPPADYERFRTLARQPSRLVLIDASNHRFTDRRPELDAAFAERTGLDRAVARRRAIAMMSGDAFRRRIERV